MDGHDDRVVNLSCLSFHWPDRITFGRRREKLGLLAALWHDDLTVGDRRSRILPAR